MHALHFDSPEPELVTSFSGFDVVPCVAPILQSICDVRGHQIAVVQLIGFLKANEVVCSGVPTFVHFFQEVEIAFADEINKGSVFVFVVV